MAEQPRNTATVPVRSRSLPNRVVNKIKRKALTFNKFMGCCSLRTGSLFIGYLNLIATLFLLGLYGYVIFIITRRSINELRRGALWYLAYVLIVLITNLVLHVILLKGVYEKRRKLLIIYLRGFFWLMIITFIVLIIIVIAETNFEKKLFATYLWSIYCLLVVRSYVIKMNEAQTQEMQMNAV